MAAPWTSNAVRTAVPPCPTPVTPLSSSPATPISRTRNASSLCVLRGYQISIVPWVSSGCICSHNESHQMETFSALLALCAGNSPATGEFPTQRPVTRNFDVFFDLRLSKGLSKLSRRGWFETPSRSSWRHSNGNINLKLGIYIQ